MLTVGLTSGRPTLESVPQVLAQNLHERGHPTHLRGLSYEPKAFLLHPPSMCTEFSCVLVTVELCVGLRWTEMKERQKETRSLYVRSCHTDRRQWLQDHSWSMKEIGSGGAGSLAGMCDRSMSILFQIKTLRLELKCKAQMPREARLICLRCKAGLWRGA